MAERIEWICDGCQAILKVDDIRYAGVSSRIKYHACSYKCKLQADRDTRDYTWMKPIRWVKA